MSLQLIVVIAIALTAVLTAVYVHLTARFFVRRRPPDPEVTPGRYGLPYAEVSFRSRDGLRLCGWFIPADQPQGTVVFCHGQAGSMDRDTLLLPLFHEAGFNVLMFDFRGHGRSEGDTVSLGSFEHLDLLAALECLAGRGIERVGVIGFSMGGAVALSTARQSQAIAAVVSDSGFTSLHRVMSGGLCERGLPYPLAGALSWLTLKYVSYRLGVDVEASEPGRQVDASFRCPFLAIQGDADPYVPVSDITTLVQQAGGPAETWLVSGAGHREARDLYPEEYRRRVLSFFTKHLSIC